MRLTVIGTGYVGLVAGAGFSDFGNDVTCVDVDAGKIARLERGEVPIYEPGLDTLIAKNVKAGRLRFSTDVASAIQRAEAVFIGVGTPSADDGSADLSAVFAVAETIGKNLPEGFTVVATKSTVPVGTADKVRTILQREVSRREGRREFGVASNPEFLKEGAAIQDFMKPDRVVIGSDEPRALEVLRSLYAPFVRTSDRIHSMDARSAELTKYASNALLATRISFMNDLAVLAEKLGADIELVRKGVGSDPRIGPKFLFPGPGFGGSCFPKDLAALAHTGEAAGHDLALVRAAQDINRRQKHVLGQKVVARLGAEGDVRPLEGKTIAVWGLAFKPETDDIRESPALTLIEDLLRAGARVRATDPQAIANVRAHFGAAEGLSFHDDPYETAASAHGLALVTEWHEYRRPDFDNIKSILSAPNLFDGRNVWDPTDLVRRGFFYTGIGRKL
jgi:UDPglucose 6-dehydrogenase